MCSVPVPGWNAKVNGLRRPTAQTARAMPTCVAKNGLSFGIVPSALKRRSLPNGELRSCASGGLAFSPTPT